VSSPVLLRDNISGQYVDAVLHDRVLPPLAASAETSWAEFITDARNRDQIKLQSEIKHMDHEGWKWHEKVGITHNLLPYPTLAIECSGKIQGLMMLITDGYVSRLPTSQGKPIVYINLISTAPWNIENFNKPPRYSGVGSILVGAAIQISMDYGFKGRVGLNSLTDSEPFYERLNFEFLTRDPDKQNLKYYELSAKHAAEFLK
jgi:hypothetical protein